LLCKKDFFSFEFMKTFSRLSLLLLILIALYLCFYPVPIDPAPWTPPPSPGFTGPFAANNDLSGLEVLAPECPGCEDVDVDEQGRLYGAAEDGRILRFSDPVGPAETFAATGGRPLGLDFGPGGLLFVADAEKGLLAVDTAGNIAVLAMEHDGKAFGFTDDLEVGPDSIVYFSDASWKFSAQDYKLDLLEHRPNGRLLSYDLRTGQVDLLLDSLYFANGVAVSPENDFVLVCETGAYRIKRYWLRGERKGESDILIDNLPGFPDGVSRGSGGIFWVAIASPRTALLDGLLDKPFLRKIVARLPNAIQPGPKLYGFVLGIDRDGRVVHNLQDPEGRFAPITSVQEAGGYLYLSSLSANGIGRVVGSGQSQ
jgi:sugar lactone lactonase YvrE